MQVFFAYLIDYAGRLSEEELPGKAGVQYLKEEAYIDRAENIDRVL
jgi:hypothetical protein